jgi:hypothetical protein
MKELLKGSPFLRVYQPEREGEFTFYRKHVD